MRTTTARYRRHRHYEAVAEVLRRLGLEEGTVIEFGCRGGKLSDFLPPALKYVGVEAKPRAAYIARRNGAYVVTSDWVRGTDFPRGAEAALCVRAERFPIGSVFTRAKLALKAGGVAVTTVLTELAEPYLQEARRVFRHVQVLNVEIVKEKVTILIAQEAK